MNIIDIVIYVHHDLVSEYYIVHVVCQQPG